MSPEILLYIVFGISSIALIGVILIYIKVSRFFKSGDKDLESFLNKILDKMSSLNVRENEIEAITKKLLKKNSTSIRGVHAARYNPFKDQGGNQSFSVAMVDEEENGVIFSSLYSRERNSFFLKPIINGASEHELTEEERMVLSKAIQKTK